MSIISGTLSIYNYRLISLVSIVCFFLSLLAAVHFGVLYAPDFLNICAFIVVLASYLAIFSASAKRLHALGHSSLAAGLIYGSIILVPYASLFTDQFIPVIMVIWGVVLVLGVLLWAYLMIKQ